jgi:hypothetical protein
MANQYFHKRNVNGEVTKRSLYLILNIGTNYDLLVTFSRNIIKVSNEMKRAIEVTIIVTFE